MGKLAIKFNKEILPELKKTCGKKNIFEVPRLQKVVISAGIGDFKEDDKAIEKIVSDLAKITGQKPKINHSKKAVSAFKLRIGQPVGVTVTLRSEKMFDFVERLNNVTLPRVRDFRGLSKKSFDGRGNFSLGIKEHTIFPEIKYEEVSINFGLEVNINTTAKNNNDAEALLNVLGFPFEKKIVNRKDLSTETGVHPVKSSSAGIAESDI